MKMSTPPWITLTSSKPPVIGYVNCPTCGHIAPVYKNNYIPAEQLPSIPDIREKEK